VRNPRPSPLSNAVERPARGRVIAKGGTMGIFERWGRGDGSPEAGSVSGPANEPVLASGGAAGDEHAIARYRYLLRTASPETIEQAHAEAFARLTPEQRRKVLQDLASAMPEAERAAVARDGVGADALARAATRAEIRRPGALERVLGAGSQAGPAGPGVGGLMAGTLLSSLAGSVLGSVIAQQFFAHRPEAAASIADPWANAPADADLDDAMLADPGDAGFDDGGSFDV